MTNPENLEKIHCLTCTQSRHSARVRYHVIITWYLQIAHMTQNYGAGWRGTQSSGTLSDGTGVMGSQLLSNSVAGTPNVRLVLACDWESIKRSGETTWRRAARYQCLKIHKFGSSQRRSKLLLESVRESMTVASIVRFTNPVVNIHCLYSSHALVKGEVGMLHCLAFHEGII